MKKVTILMLEKCTPIVPVGAMELLRKAGVIHQRGTNSLVPFFDIEVVALNNKQQNIGSGLTVSITRAIDEIEQTDLLLIPAIEFDVQEKLKANQGAVSHIKRLHDNGADIGSMCTGAFLLAEAGLLKNKNATTHWFMSGTFEKMYPDVNLQDERMIVDNGRLITCGGATSFINLVLYLVEKYCGKETAVVTSKMLLIDYQKPLQNHYAIFLPQIQHNDTEVAMVQEYLHKKGKLSTVNELADMANMSLSTFQRRFKKVTGQSPLKYMQKVLVEKAKNYLEKTDKTFDEIVFEIGYNDTASFRSIFRKQTGFTPSKYKERYNWVQ